MQSMVNNRTAVLWIKYMEMVDILRLFIKAKRMAAGFCTSRPFKKCCRILQLQDIIISQSPHTSTVNKCKTYRTRTLNCTEVSWTVTTLSAVVIDSGLDCPLI